MTIAPALDSRPRMGRPPLNVKETKIRLSPDARERIVALVGPHRMAEFIREAVDAEIKRREKSLKTQGTKAE